MWPKSLGVSDQAAPEVVLPDAVDEDAGGERVARVSRSSGQGRGAGSDSGGGGG